MNCWFWGPKLPSCWKTWMALRQTSVSWPHNHISSVGCGRFWVHPGRLTWNLRIHPRKRRNIFQTIIFRFYVNLGACKFFDGACCFSFGGVGRVEVLWVASLASTNLQCLCSWSRPFGVVVTCQHPAKLDLKLIPLQSFSQWFWSFPN